MLNCIYDCRYCFLQGMYPSAHYVLFINFEDFLSDINAKSSQCAPEPSWFFSGYDCDSLALDQISNFVPSFLPYFKDNPTAHLELRTKSVNIQSILKHEPLANIITAFSFTPDELGKQIEKGVPTVSSRIKAMQKLTQPVGLLGCASTRSLTAKILISVTVSYFRIFSRKFQQIKFTPFHSVPFVCPLPFLRKWKNYIPRKSSLPVSL